MKRFLLLAGLTFGAFAWAANTQLGEILPYAECRMHIALLALTSLAAGLLSLGATLLSWCQHRVTDPDVDTFLSRLGLLGGVLFAFAIALQGAASLVLSGCEQ